MGIKGGETGARALELHTKKLAAIQAERDAAYAEIIERVSAHEPSLSGVPHAVRIVGAFIDRALLIDVVLPEIRAKYPLPAPAKKGKRK